MKDILLKHYSEVLSILERFFKLNYNRNSIPEILPFENKDVFEFACKIFKRGFIGTSFHNSSNERNDGESFSIIDSNFLFIHKIKSENYFSYLPSESTKNLNTVRDILKIIPENTKEIFVFGGGITLDIGGFIAGLLQLPVHYNPTTLLACVDAAVGGKTGVNFMPYGKNQVGLFYAPKSISFSISHLSTLSIIEKVCGAVEAAKHAYLFGECENDIPILEKIISNCISEKEFREIINKNFNYKNHVVDLDQFETNGIRASLNLGHTFAHVLEALAERGDIDFIPHGIAVAHGLHFLFGNHLIDKNAVFENFIDKVVTKYSIVYVNKIELNTIIHLLSQDKKNNKNQKCTFSVPKYGVFSSNQPSQLTQEFPIETIAHKMIEWLDGFGP